MSTAKDHMLKVGSIDQFTDDELACEIRRRAIEADEATEAKIAAVTPAFDPISAMRSHRERKTAQHRNRNLKQ